MKTNHEIYNSTPMSEVLEAYDREHNRGFRGDFVTWLEQEHIDPALKGKYIGTSFYAYADSFVETKIREMEEKVVKGYLLEFYDKDNGKWEPSEIDVDTDSNMWRDNQLAEALNMWFDEEVCIGFFTAFPSAWFMSSDDWDFRLGVDFDARYTPTEKPSPNKVWYGEPKGTWRVRYVEFKGTLSEKAKDLIRKNPALKFAYCGDYKPE